MSPSGRHTPLDDSALALLVPRPTASQAMKAEIAQHEEARARLTAEVVRLEAGQQEVWFGGVVCA